jgi:hypothetical protein
MTKANCERLLKHYEEKQKDASLSEQARLNMKVAAADMKAHIAKYHNSKK